MPVIQSHSKMESADDDGEARLFLYYRDASNRLVAVDFGTITGFSDNMNKAVTATPIASQRSDCTLAIESNSHTTYSVSFSYISNQKEGLTLSQWCEDVMALVNTWQAKTDGYRMMFNVRGAKAGEPTTNGSRRIVYVCNAHYPAIYRQNVYITSLSLKYAAGTPEQATGEMMLSVGGMSKARGSSSVYDGSDKYVYMGDEYEVRYR